MAVRGCAKTVDPQALTVALSPAGLRAEPEVRPELSPAATTPHHLPVTVPLTVFPRGANFPIVSQACAIFSTVQLECLTARSETPSSAPVTLGAVLGLLLGTRCACTFPSLEIRAQTPAVLCVLASLSWEQRTQTVAPSREGRASQL